MANNSGIQWTDATWNPVAGCSPVSPGCTNCYAATMARRLEAMGQEKYKGTAERRGRVNVFTSVINTDPDALDLPLRWRKPKRIFVNSMSDLFHEGVPDEFIDRVFAVMALCPQHTFQVLTKRPERMAEYLTQRRWEIAQRVSPRPDAMPWPLPNVWLGVSVEDQQRADERIPHLLRTRAAVRFLSVEPLLGPVEFSNVSRRSDAVEQLGKPALSGIHWVIVGGESGPGSRVCHIEWVRSVVRQCRDAGVAVFVKQLGANAQDTYIGDGTPVFFTDPPRPGDRLFRDKKGGNPAEWSPDLRVREFPDVSK